MHNGQMGLFQSEAPLAHRIRPKTLTGFEGQSEIKNRIEKLNPERLPHIIFHGPPGCGKTTLAHILSGSARLYPFNAVLGGVKELRSLIQQAKQEQGIGQAVIFIDEIHRFNKAQQDALLPYLEAGEFVLFGATTENPNTSLNKAILSRVQKWRLEPLDDDSLMSILKNACEQMDFHPKQEILEYLAKHTNGDARVALNQLESLHQNKSDLENLNFETIKENILQENRRYDKDSERHYDVISAFIKSVRGSDVDAALLWLAVMLDGGEDIEFIARRLIILASEDVGNADPRALQMATSAHYGIKNIGMPEARIILAQATTYLAKAPKSNASYRAIDAALDYVRNNPTIEVPTHLRNHHPDKKNYRYPHNATNHWLDQRYSNEDETFFESSQMGYEKLQEDFQQKNRRPQ
jgi:putative ATPase